jgi:hypothetical protein
MSLQRTVQNSILKLGKGDTVRRDIFPLIAVRQEKRCLRETHYEEN